MHLFIVALVVGIASTSTINDCPASVTKDGYTKVLGDSCFRFYVHDAKDYVDAKAVCQKDGGDLAMPKTKQLNDLLTSTLQQSYSSATRDIWIGLSDRAVENTFVWEDGTPMTYQVFALGNGPRVDFISHDLEDCVALRPKDGSWHDYHCDSEFFGLINERKPWVCQYPLTAGTTSLPVASTTGCAVLRCSKDCGMSGFKTDPTTNCMLCECDA